MDVVWRGHSGAPVPTLELGQQRMEGSPNGKVMTSRKEVDPIEDDDSIFFRTMLHAIKIRSGTTSHDTMLQNDWLFRLQALLNVVSLDSFMRVRNVQHKNRCERPT